MNSYNENIDKLKRIPLFDFVQNQLGYKFKPDKGKGFWKIFETKNGDIIKVGSSPNEEGYYLFKSEDIKSGSIVDILIYEGGKWLNEKGDLDYKKVFSTFLRVDFSVQKTSYIREVKKTKYLSRLEVEAKVCHLPRNQEMPKNNYFSKRGLASSVLAQFDLRANANETVFPLYLITDGKIEPASAIRYDFSNLPKYFLGKKGGSVSVLMLKSSRDFRQKKPLLVYLFESPIDALSFYQLHEIELKGSPFVLISCLGELAYDFLAGLQDSLKTLNAKEVIVCFDADKNGRKMTLRLKKYINPFPFVEKKVPNSYKDWNEVLMEKKTIKS